MIDQEKLLSKYYKAETSLEEEKLLNSEFMTNEIHEAEKDMFGYFDSEGKVPEDLEEMIFTKVVESSKKRKTIRRRFYSITSVAATFLIVLSIYLDFRNKKITKMESDFFVMEQALFQMSQGIQPEEQEDMLVLWVDDDVEIIIN